MLGTLVGWAHGIGPANRDGFVALCCFIEEFPLLRGKYLTCVLKFARRDDDMILRNLDREIEIPILKIEFSLT